MDRVAFLIAKVPLATSMFLLLAAFALDRQEINGGEQMCHFFGLPSIYHIFLSITSIQLRMLANLGKGRKQVSDYLTASSIYKARERLDVVVSLPTWQARDLITTALAMKFVDTLPGLSAARWECSIRFPVS
jgi:hypothetical protein